MRIFRTLKYIFDSILTFWETFLENYFPDFYPFFIYVITYKNNIPEYYFYCIFSILSIFAILWWLFIPRLQNFYMGGFWAYCGNLYLFQICFLSVMLLFPILIQRPLAIHMATVYFSFSIYFVGFMFVFIPLLELLYYCCKYLCIVFNIPYEILKLHFMHTFVSIIVVSFFYYFVLLAYRF